MRKSHQNQTSKLSLLLITIQLSLVSLSMYQSVLPWVLLIVACAATIRASITDSKFTGSTKCNRLGLLGV